MVDVVRNSLQVSVSSKDFVLPMLILYYFAKSKTSRNIQIQIGVGRPLEQFLRIIFYKYTTCFIFISTIFY